MALHELRPAKNSTKRKKRIARGIGSGKGKTATRGTKGQKAKRNMPLWFEGGQTPIHRRLPVKKGFRNVNHKEYAIVNVDDLDAPVALTSVEIIGDQELLDAGLADCADTARSRGTGVGGGFFIPDALFGADFSPFFPFLPCPLIGAAFFALGVVGVVRTRGRPPHTPGIE